MEAHERRAVMIGLDSSEARLLEALSKLTPEQWRFHETAERWSIAEIVEHLILFEGFILGAVEKALQGQAEEGKMSEAAGKEHLVLGLADARATRFTAREIVRPAGRWSEPVELIVAFREARAKTAAFAAGTEAAFRKHFFAHIAFGDLDCYQWLRLIGQHTLRHVYQIEEIKADPAYPAVRDAR